LAATGIALTLSAGLESAQASTLQFYSAFDTSLGHCEDTTLRQGMLSDTPQSTRGYFSVATHELDMSFSESEDVNGLIRFPSVIGDAPGQVPEGAVIQKAELVMYALSPLYGGPITVHQVLESWDEQTATWNSRGDSLGPWSSEGALSLSSDSVPTAEMESEDFPQCGYWDCPEGTMGDGWTRTDITEVMQRWVDDPTSNYGLMLDVTEGRSAFVSCEGELHPWFYSKYPMLANEDLLRPGLVVTFDMPEPELAEPKVVWENTGDKTGAQEPLAILEAYPYAFIAGVEYLDDGDTEWIVRRYWSRTGDITFAETEQILGTPTSIIKGATHFFVGGCRISDAGDCDSYIRAYHFDGTLDWETPLAVAPFDMAGGHDIANALAYSNKRLFAATTVTSENGDTDYLVIKLDPATGEVIATDHIETPFVDDGASDIHVEGSYVYASGSTANDGQADAFVKGYGASRLNDLWERHFDLAGESDAFTSLLVSSSKVIVAGTGTSQTGDTDVIAMGYKAATGTPLWSMPIVRDYKGGDDTLVAATWNKSSQARFMLAANVDQPLGVPGFVVSGHYSSGADAWRDETVISGSVTTPYAVSGGKYRTFVAAQGLDASGDTQYLARSYAGTTGAGYWQHRIGADDTFSANLIAADVSSENRVYVAGCQVNEDGDCSISVRLLMGTK